MLISVDTENGVVVIYGNTTVTKIPISQVDRLRTMLSGKTVQYISEVQEASGDDIISMVLSITVDPNTPKPIIQAANERMWIYAKGSGYMNIPEAGLKFDGPADFKSLDTLGHDVFERFPVLQQLKEKDMLGVASTSEMTRLKKGSAAKRRDMEDRMLRNSDGSSIIVDDHNSVVDNRGRVKRQMGPEFEDVTGDQPDDDFISEAAKEAEKLGIDISNVDDQEG